MPGSVRCWLSTELVTALIVFHVLQGWVYAALTEHRDISLWATRLHTT